MKLYSQIILLTLTLLLLVSSTGMAVGMHICGGELRDITFFGAKADCPMDKPQKKAPACHAPQQNANDDACCEDHQVVLEQLNASDEHKTVTLNKLQDIKFIAALNAVILRFFASEVDLRPSYSFYESPPIARDIPVLVQSFLI